MCTVEKFHDNLSVEIKMMINYSVVKFSICLRSKFDTSNTKNTQKNMLYNIVVVLNSLVVKVQIF